MDLHLLYCYNHDCEFSTNFGIFLPRADHEFSDFDHKKFIALIIILAKLQIQYLVHSRVADMKSATAIDNVTWHTVQQNAKQQAITITNHPNISITVTSRVTQFTNIYDNNNNSSKPRQNTMLHNDTQTHSKGLDKLYNCLVRHSLKVSRGHWLLSAEDCVSINMSDNLHLNGHFPGEPGSAGPLSFASSTCYAIEPLQ